MKTRSLAESDAEKMRSSAKLDADEMRSAARASRDAAKQVKAKAEDEANQRLHRADEEAKRIMDTAEAKAKEIAGDAYEAMNKAEEYKSLAASLKNIVNGYGDQWIKPTFTLLDQLAEDFGYAEAGQRLKAAQENSLRMVKEIRSPFHSHNPRYA